MSFRFLSKLGPQLIYLQKNDIFLIKINNLETKCNITLEITGSERASRASEQNQRASYPSERANPASELRFLRERASAS